MYDVAIIGVGIHPFGRFGAKTGIDMGADAIRAACTDAGVQWSDVQFAVGGSFEVDNPDAVVGRVGMTGIPFMDVYNGCATAGTALETAADAIRYGKHEMTVAVGMDKHEPGAFTSDPSYYGAPPWYGDIGHFLTTKFFAMKINRYMHDHGISHESLARVAERRTFRNGVRTIRRRSDATRDERSRTSSSSRMLNYPLTQYMFCSPGRGGGGGRCSARPRSRRTSYTSKPDLPAGCTALRTRYAMARSRCTTPGWPVDADVPTTVRSYASKAAYEMAGVGPQDVDVDPAPGHRCGSRDLSTWPRTASARMASRRSMLADARRPTSTARCLSTPTAG